MCGENQIFAQRLSLKDFVKVLNCPVTLILTHPINMIMYTCSEIVQIVSDQCVQTTTRCQH